MSDRSLATKPATTTPPVLAAPARFLQRKCACGKHAAGGECGGCKKKGMLQRSASGSPRSQVAPPIVSRVLQSGGTPLDHKSREYFEPRFRHDFAKVRVHTGSQAAASAEAVNAHAYTVGSHIVFGANQSESGGTGNRLLAHELAHVVQQSSVPQPGSSIRVLDDPKSERSADRAANKFESGREAADTMQPVPLSVQRDEAAAQPAELGWFGSGLVEVAAAPAAVMGSSIHSIVKATFRGFFSEIKAQSAKRGEQIWDKTKEVFGSVSNAAKFIGHYWWGLVKGIFSPITGLFDMAVLIGKLGYMSGQIQANAWTRRGELVDDIAKIGTSMSALGQRAGAAFSEAKAHPVETVKALSSWFSGLEQQAVTGAESGGHSAAEALLSQLDKPPEQLGEGAGEIVGTILVNLVLLVFTDGIGDAITQIAKGLGELGEALGQFGKAAEMLGKAAGKVGQLLGKVGGWITTAEGVFAKAAETILKPLAPLMRELGNVIGGLRNFLRKLLGVATEEATVALEESAGAAGKVLDRDAPAPHAPGAAPSKAPPVKAPPTTPKHVDALAAKPAAPKPLVTDTPAKVPTVETPAAPLPKPPAVKPRARIFQGVSSETEEMLAKRPGFARLLEEHPEAADLFKLCKSPCFPDFLSEQEMAERLLRLEKIQKAAAEAGVPLDRKLTRELLHQQKDVKGVDDALRKMEDTLSHLHEQRLANEGEALVDPDEIFKQPGVKDRKPVDVRLGEAREGQVFDTLEGEKYPHNQVPMRDRGGSLRRLDSYDPATGDIISRKSLSTTNGQIAFADEGVMTDYFQEFPLKYPNGATIADVPSAGSLAGKTLKGRYVLEVPVQRYPIGQKILDQAKLRGIIIRDVTGKIY
jgi:hypothetical protein